MYNITSYVMYICSYIIYSGICYTIKIYVCIKILIYRETTYVKLLLDLYHMFFQSTFNIQDAINYYIQVIYHWMQNALLTLIVSFVLIKASFTCTYHIYASFLWFGFNIFYWIFHQKDLAQVLKLISPSKFSVFFLYHIHVHLYNFPLSLFLNFIISRPRDTRTYFVSLRVSVTLTFLGAYFFLVQD